MRKVFFRIIKGLVAFFVLCFIIIFFGVVLPKQYYRSNGKLLTHFILQNCHVVDIVNNTIHYNRSITIREGIIYAIDSMTTAAVSDTIQIIDTKGSYMMPSLWDMHVHTIGLSPQLHFPLLIANGVTHIRDMGDGDSWKSDINDMRIRDKTKWEQMEKKQALLMPTIMEATSFHLEEVRGMTKEQVNFNAQNIVEQLRLRKEPFIKVQLKEGDYPIPFFYALQKQAKQKGIGVLGHLPADVDLDSVFRLGFKSVEHAWAFIPHFVTKKQLTGSDISRKAHDLQLYDSVRANDLLALMAKNHIYYVPTHISSNRKEYLGFTSGFNQNPNNQYVETVQLMFWKLLNRLHTLGYDRKTDLPVLKKYYERGLSITQMAHRNGVKILAGTDALDRHVYYGISLHEELAELVKGGLSNAEALKAATLNAADYYGLSSQYGSIDIGKKASFIVLKRNPLENIRYSRDIQMVFFNNKLYDQTEIHRMKQYTIDQAKSYRVSCRFIWNMIKN